jgi:transcription initiation factor TFIIB
MINLEEIISCRECNSTNIEYDSKHGDIYCNDCGLILEERMIDQGPEWREFNTDSDKIRATQGKDLAFHTTLRTSFDPRESSKENKYLAQRISKAQRYIGRSTDRSLILAMILLETLTTQLEVSDVAHKEAALFYRRAVKKNLIRGRSIDSVGAACLYVSSRRCGKVLDYTDLEKKTKATAKEIAKCVRLIQRELELPHRITNPTEYTTQYLGQLYDDESTKREMQKEVGDLLDKLGEENINNPKSAAVALLYIAGILTDHRRNQKELAQVSNLTEVTIRNRYKEIVKILNIDLNACPTNYKTR